MEEDVHDSMTGTGTGWQTTVPATVLGGDPSCNQVEDAENIHPPLALSSVFRAKGGG